jgi:hypothetical protein
MVAAGGANARVAVPACTGRGPDGAAGPKVRERYCVDGFLSRLQISSAMSA